MGAILSQNSTPKLKGEGSSLIEIQELPDDELSREAEDVLKMNEVLRCPTDPAARQFVKTFQQLQKQKEQFHIQLHNEVIQWRLMYQRGISNKFERNKKVNMLIQEFVKLHEQLDEFLEQERRNLERILPKPRYFMPAGTDAAKKKCATEHGECSKNRNTKNKDESLELTPEAMQRLVCFQKCNDQHILVLTQVLSDIEDCKKFAKAQSKPSAPTVLTKQTSLTESAELSTNSRPVAITVSTDSEEN